MTLLKLRLVTPICLTIYHEGRSQLKDTSVPEQPND